MRQISPTSIAKRFGSITTRMLVILALAFMLITLMVNWVIETYAKPRVVAMTSESIEGIGNEVINSIMANISRVDGIAKATSAISGGLPKDQAIYQDTLGNLMNQTDKNIVGGGVWFDPNMYQSGQERQSFVWARDNSGVMQRTERYNAKETVFNPYYRDSWYIPALYARHDHCVWSRAYIDPATKSPMMTCAKALYNSRNQAFDGVISFNLILDNLDAAMQVWRKKVGGYVFLIDLDNRFLTFPDKSLVTYESRANPQGEMLSVEAFAKAQPGFDPIADHLTAINDDLLDKAIATDESRYNFAANSIVSTTNAGQISAKESKLLSALLLLNGEQSMNFVESHLVDTVAVPNDLILKQPSTAFIFRMPFTYWKMVIVKPDSALTSVANGLSNQLLRYMLFGFIPILLMTAWAFRNYFTRPLRHMAEAVADMGALIERKQYQQLGAHKLPTSNVSEIQIISEQTNQLIDRVVENEGALAEINVLLEKKVVERTQALQQAMDELKASQVQLVRSEKMATLGQMVAGVAHEVNTPLGYVRSNMELVGENLSRFDELTQHTEQLLTVLKDANASQEERDAAITATLQCCAEIKEDEVSEDLAGLVNDGLFGVDQIAELVLSLRDFSRIDESKIKDININDCINSSLVMARNNLKTLDVITDLGDLPPVQCNPSQINQVLLNLFNNAAQAIPSDRKGQLTIVSALAEEHTVTISVTDNGKGMAEEVLARMFEPFFTTKKAGEGTGLGLAISTEIMEQHGGKLEAQSSVGEGTRFVMTLPVAQTSSQAQQTPKALFEA